MLCEHTFLRPHFVYVTGCIVVYLNIVLCVLIFH